MLCGTSTSWTQTRERLATNDWHWSLGEENSNCSYIRKTAESCGSSNRESGDSPNCITFFLRQAQNSMVCYDHYSLLSMRRKIFRTRHSTLEEAEIFQERFGNSKMFLYQQTLPALDLVEPQYWLTFVLQQDLDDAVEMWRNMGFDVHQKHITEIRNLSNAYEEDRTDEEDDEEDEDESEPKENEEDEDESETKGNEEDEDESVTKGSEEVSYEHCSLLSKEEEYEPSSEPSVHTVSTCKAKQMIKYLQFLGQVMPQLREALDRHPVL